MLDVAAGFDSRRPAVLMYVGWTQKYMYTLCCCERRRSQVAVRKL